MLRCADGEDSFFAIGTEFKTPMVPRKDGRADDWRAYPRCPKNSDLLTMRVPPESEHGYFVAERPGEACFAYVWERSAFPWLMTWEENNARAQAPWSGKTLCRGLEFGSVRLLCAVLLILQNCT